MNKKIIYCNCQGNILDLRKSEAIENCLQSIDIPSLKVSDLCSICSTQKEKAREIFSSDEIMIIACYPRAVKLLLDYAGVNAESKKFHVVNFRNEHEESISQQIKAFTVGEKQAVSLSELKGDPEWPAWFPMIDYDRCSSCGQCADFCLFGVYEKTEGKVQVVNPKGCKNNCPACARICPQTAIVFPKYQHGGAIAGDESINEAAEQERQRMDLDAILGSDIYKALEMRKAKRRAIIKEEAMNKALEEREKALKEQQKN
jgi:NAD-dependent dihydropyrimidine dehydrogenase PreA subunit